ncbi:MAG: YraN family protein [Deltaproteobacteria bacterium]|nr:YraN family protein [Deltaproteobacteria bacterium]
MHLIEAETLGYCTDMRSGEAKRDLGRLGEQTAEAFLCAQRYRVIARNYRCRLGEIDLVVRDGPTLVFVEVRSQTGQAFGDPLESVTLRKQRQIAKAAVHYVVAHRLEEQPMRFDVIGIRWVEGHPHFSHVKAAFELPAKGW